MFTHDEQILLRLKKILEILSPEDLSKPIVNINVDNNFSILDRTEKIILESSGETKNIMLAGLGQIHQFSSIVHLAYFSNSGELVIKPTLIQELLEEK